MAYHDFNDTSTILTCPDCGGTEINPIAEDVPSWSQIPDKSLYEDTNSGLINHRQNYVERWGHEPKERQHHFFCEPCYEHFYNFYGDEGDYGEYYPVYPFKELKRVPLHEIEFPKKFVNPYSLIDFND